MMLRDFAEAMGKFLSGVLLTGLLLFVPAGTLDYFNGWLLMGVLFIPMFLAGMVMLVKDPDLLKSRLNARETQAEQRTVIYMSGLMFAAGFVLAGLGVRFGWPALPMKAAGMGTVLLLASYILYAKVLQENRYLSRTIKVQEHQKVIDTGLYRFVRHPMYSATIFLFLSIPVVLGSVVSLPVFLIYPAVIGKRIRHEEAFLEKELPGYAEYKKKVRYRLIPFIW